MIELTPEQTRLLAQSPVPQVLDPTTRVIYTLVATETTSVAVNESPRESPAPPWRHLVVRHHPWRKQLYIKGRNMTVRQLVGGVKANKFAEEEAAANYHLPVEAIREALAYFEANPEVIALDHATELYLISLTGSTGRGPESLTR